MKRTDNGTTIGLAVYSLVLAGAPGASYQWTGITSGAFLAGGIAAYRNVDNTTPWIAGEQNGQTTAAPTCPASCTHTTPSVIAAVPDSMIVASFATAADDTWTEPAGMAEAFDTVTTSTFVAIEQASILQQPASSVSETATAVSTSAVGVTHIFALRGLAATTLGSISRAITSPTAGPALFTNTFTTSGTETFGDGDRFQLEVVTPNDAANCATALYFDSSATPSSLSVATIVPEGLLGLLLLAPALPLGARWCKRRRP